MTIGSIRLIADAAGYVDISGVPAAIAAQLGDILPSHGIMAVPDPPLPITTPVVEHIANVESAAPHVDQTDPEQMPHVEMPVPETIAAPAEAPLAAAAPELAAAAPPPSDEPPSPISGHAVALEPSPAAAATEVDHDPIGLMTRDELLSYLKEHGISATAVFSDATLRALAREIPIGAP
jgi:hypothetical protein